MPDRAPQWVHLTDVAGSFAAKVLRARLESEGIVTRLRGFDEGPYPFQSVVHVDVPAEHAAAAREALLADEVDAAFDDFGRAPARHRAGRFRLRRRGGS